MKVMCLYFSETSVRKLLTTQLSNTELFDMNHRSHVPFESR